MLEFWHRIAEERIEKAMQEGQFDNLEGAGKPFAFEDDSMIPEELRMAYKILRNSGHAPPEVVERKEIQRIEDLLEDCEDEQTRCRQIKKLNYLIMQLNTRYGRNVCLERSQRYYQRVVEKVEVCEKADGGGQQD